MTAPARRPIAVFATLVAFAAWAGAAFAGERILMLDNNLGAERPFVEALVERANSDNPFTLLFIEEVYAARAELNGDGLQELLLTFVNLRWCGNQGNCGAFIYSKERDEWHYRGNVQAWETGDPRDVKRSAYELVLLPQTHNGWRVLGDQIPDGSVYCWSRIEEPSVVDVTPFGEPVPVGSEGYFAVGPKEVGACR
ncbi:MAG TPA: hypothetical protein VED40_05940 [Azospirillaceae bacterium]|nr:hypothetical protein [Azospirillaceae bacterium]